MSNTLHDVIIPKASKLWRAGVLGREIAQELGISERRLSGIASANRDLFPSRLKKDGDKTAAEILRNIETKAEAANTLMKPKFPEKAPGYPGVTVRERSAFGCEFPLWGHHEYFDFETSLYCGAPRVDGRSYCAFHCREATGAGSAQERGAAAVLLKATRAGA